MSFSLDEIHAVEPEGFDFYEGGPWRTNGFGRRGVEEYFDRISDRFIDALEGIGVDEVVKDCEILQTRLELLKSIERRNIFEIVDIYTSTSKIRP